MYIYIYSVATIQHGQFMLHVILFPSLNVLQFYIGTFRSRCAVCNLVFCIIIIIIIIIIWNL